MTPGTVGIGRRKFQRSQYRVCPAPAAGRHGAGDRAGLGRRVVGEIGNFRQQQRRGFDQAIGLFGGRLRFGETQRQRNAGRRRQAEGARAGEGVEVQNVPARKAPDPEPPRNPGAVAMKRGIALGRARQPVGKRGKGQILVRAVGPPPQGLARSDDQHGCRGHSLQVVRRSPFGRKPVILDHARLCRFRTVNGHSGFASFRSSAISAVIPTEASGSRPFDGLRTGPFDTPRISSGATQDEGWLGKVNNISLIPSRPAGPYRGTERTSGPRPCGRLSRNRACRGSRVDHLCGAA